MKTYGFPTKPKSKRKQVKKNSYAFCEPMITDDKNWRIPKRLEWAKRSAESHAKLIAKYCKPNEK